MITVTSPELMQLLERIAVALERQTELLDRISGQIGYDVPPVYEAGAPAPEFVPFATSQASEAPAIDPSPIPEPQTSEGYTGMVKAIPREEAEAWWNSLAQKAAEQRAAAAAPGPAFGTHDPKPWETATPAPAPSADKKPWDR